MGVNKAVELQGMPKTTLKDRVSGRVAQSSEIGPKSYLTNQEQKHLAHNLRYLRLDMERLTKR